jgi:DNA-binding CsgD family transcriptional regulator
MSGMHTISTKSRRETVIKFLFLHGKAPKEIQAILTETLACLTSLSG